MATLFIDFDQGNDDYGGTSFALLASGVDGTIVTATFTSATASFPNDGSLIGQYLSIFNGTIYAVYNITAWVSATSLTIAAISGGTALANQAARQYYIGGRWKNITTGATAVRTIPGDTIRIMGSPAPTSLGQNGVWTSQTLQPSVLIASSTNTTPISVTRAAHGYSTGDTVIVSNHTVNTNANGTWEITVTGANTFTLNGSVGNGVGGNNGGVRLRNNTRVMLTTAVTQNIASTGPNRTAWVASANVSTTTSTSNFKEHTNSDSINPVAAFTTGKAAYYALPSTLDLSGYQQVSFWIFCSVPLTAGQVELRLCSDAIGDATVNTISVPAVPASSRWQVVTVDTGAALGASVASISLNVNTDLSTTATVTILLNNIIACKASSAADSLTLTSLIGKNTTGETFWGIQSINGTRVMLDADTNATPTTTSITGYYGTSGTATTWKRETIKLGPTTGSTVLQTMQEAGTDGNPITYSGGWDRTNMSTRNLETWLDAVNGTGTFLSPGARNFIDVLGFAGVRATQAFLLNGSYCNFSIVAGNNCTPGSNAGAIYATSPYNTVTVGHAVSNLSSGVGFASNSNQLTITYGVLSNGLPGVYLGSIDMVVKGASPGTLIANNGNSAIQAGAFAVGKCENFTTLDNANSAIRGSTLNTIYLNNVLINESSEVQLADTVSRVYSQNHDQTANNHKIFNLRYSISSATDQRKTPSGISWKLQPLSTADIHSRNPIVFSLAKVACSANNLVTIKAWMYRDNAGLTMRLVCKGGQLAGVASDVTASVTTTNAWEEETITFTPTETGVVEITAEAWGGTTFSGWVDDMTISQA
jgi:hypothetical protein